MVQEEIKINTVPDELYNLTQLAEVTLAAGKLSTTNINQIKNYIQQKTISYDEFSGVASAGYHDGYFTLPTVATSTTATTPTIQTAAMSALYHRDDVRKLTDLDEYKINLKSAIIAPQSAVVLATHSLPSGITVAPSDSLSLNGQYKNAWIDNSFENLFTNYLDARTAGVARINNSHSNSSSISNNNSNQHSVIKYEKKFKLDSSGSSASAYDKTDSFNSCAYNSNSNGSNNSLDSNGDRGGGGFTKKHSINISSRSPSLSSPPLSTSSPNFMPSYERERKNFIYSHKIFDRKKARNLIIIDEGGDAGGRDKDGGDGGVEINWKHSNSDSNDLLSKSSSSSSVSSSNLHHGTSVVVDGSLCQLDHSSSGSSIGHHDKILGGGLQLDESHICPECGKKYSTSSNLARHRQTHRSLQDKKARKCEFCDKVYVSMPAYSMHVRTHNQGCKCSHCGKCFSRPWLLQGHIRTHTGEKPFKCSICPKAFADKSNLRAHIQTHSNTKPHSCVRCGKAFALKSYLYKHEESSCMKNHSRHNNGSNGTHNNVNSDGDNNSNTSSNRNEFRTKSILDRRIKKSRKMILLQQSVQHNNNNVSGGDDDFRKYSKSMVTVRPNDGGEPTELLENSFNGVDDVDRESGQHLSKLKENKFLRTSVIRKTVSGKTLNGFNTLGPSYHNHHHHQNGHDAASHHDYHPQPDLVMG